MEDKTITLTIPRKGPIRIEANGYEGSVCSTDVETVVKAIKGERVSQENKPEYYRQTKVGLSEG